MRSLPLTGILLLMAPLLPVLDYNANFMHIFPCPEWRRLRKDREDQLSAHSLNSTNYQPVAPGSSTPFTQLQVTFAVEHCSSLHGHIHNLQGARKAGRQHGSSRCWLWLHGTLLVQLTLLSARHFSHFGHRVTEGISQKVSKESFKSTANMNSYPNACYPHTDFPIFLILWGILCSSSDSTG